MKEFVVGKPYTTETTIGDRDEWLIVACDGVSSLSHSQDTELTGLGLVSYGTFVRMKKQLKSLRKVKTLKMQVKGY